MKKNRTAPSFAINKCVDLRVSRFSPSGRGHSSPSTSNPIEFDRCGNTVTRMKRNRIKYRILPLMAESKAHRKRRIGKSTVELATSAVYSVWRETWANDTINWRIRRVYVWIECIWSVQWMTIPMNRVNLWLRRTFSATVAENKKSRKRCVLGSIVSEKCSQHRNLIYSMHEKREPEFH